jgi:hypothetical protein
LTRIEASAVAAELPSGGTADGRATILFIHPSRRGLAEHTSQEILSDNADQEALAYVPVQQHHRLYCMWLILLLVVALYQLIVLGDP